MSGFAALMGAEGDASDIIERKKRDKVEEDEKRQRAEAVAAAFSKDLFSKKKQSTWGESDDEDDFFSKPVRRRIVEHSAPCRLVQIQPCLFYRDRACSFSSSSSSTC